MIAHGFNASTPWDHVVDLAFNLCTSAGLEQKGIQPPHVVAGYARLVVQIVLFFFFFFNDPPPTEISPLPLHAALPISIAGTCCGTLQCGRAATRSRPRWPCAPPGSDSGSRTSRSRPSTATSRVICRRRGTCRGSRSEEHTSELQSRLHLVCRLLLEKKK